MSKELWSYYFIRIAAYPFSWMPYSWIHRLGSWIGLLIFHCIPGYRKRVFSNLSLAKGLHLSPQQLIQVAKQTFQNLAILCLEYPRLSAEKDLSPTIFCENPEVAESLHAQGKGIIFFCGHLSNWEVLFLEGTRRMPGIAVGKPIKNKRLYRWIVSIREKYGGKIIPQNRALIEGIRALKQGKFVGIVGDQGMPSSGYSSLFLGRKAWSSTAPALLAYRTSSPIITATVHRVKNGYRIHYSDPIFPNLAEPIETEVTRMMNQALSFLEQKILASPGEWLWQHNRWKQQTPQNVYKKFRYDAICVVLPQNLSLLQSMLPHLATFRKIYPRDFLFLCAPQEARHLPLIDADDSFFYSKIEETLLPDYRSKLVFNLANFTPLKRHYLRLSAFEVLDFTVLKALAHPHLPSSNETDLSTILTRALCRKGSLWT